MPTNPITPPYRASQQVNEIGEIFGIDRTESLPLPKTNSSSSTDRRRVVAHSEPSKKLKRNEYKGVEIGILTGDYSGQKVFLGTDIVKVSMSQSANWEEKSGQRMRVGINFNNISPRTISFTADLYDPNGDISPVVENIAHIQEITKSAGNTPPFLQIKMGDTIYNNAVSTNFQPEFSEPLPTITSGRAKRSGGYRMAKVQLEFKVAGGEGSSYRSAQPFNLDTEMKSVFDNKTQEEVDKQGTQAAADLVLSDCLDTSENEELSAAIDNNTLSDPSSYLTMSRELFLQLATAGLPDNVLSDEGFRERLKKEMAVKIAKEQKSGTHTPEQLASSLYTGDPLLGYNEFPALLLAYNDALNAILDNNFVSISGTRADDELLKASKCGRAIRDSGGLRLIAQPFVEDPNFTAAGISNLLTATAGLQRKNVVSDSELKKIFGMGDRVPLQVVKEIREHKLFESKEDFIAFVTERTDGVTAQAAWANFLEVEKNTKTDINTFLKTADRAAIKKRFGVADNIAEVLENRTFSSKEDFLQTVFEVRKGKGETYTTKNGLDKAGEYWLKFRLNEAKED